MKVSVIIPVYNVKDYLWRCVESVLNQTVSDIQIILVDDGSNDGSEVVCDDIANTDARIVVIHKNNGGLSSARNTGIASADGEYICFVDSDDIIAPYYVEHLLSLCVNYNCDIAVGSYLTFTTESPTFDSDKNFNLEILTGYNAINKLFGESYVMATIACNKLYRKSLFDSVAFPEGKINEDEATAYKMYYLSSKVAFSNKCVYGYYMRPNSITKSRFSKRNFDYLEIAKERYEFFKLIGDERLYHMFLKTYCWALLDFARKVRRELKDNEKSKEFVREFKKSSKVLLKSKNVSFLKRVAIGMIRFSPSIFYLIKRKS